jgi:hypothetical protein
MERRNHERNQTGWLCPAGPFTVLWSWPFPGIFEVMRADQRLRTAHSSVTPPSPGRSTAPTPSASQPATWPASGSSTDAEASTAGGRSSRQNGSPRAPAPTPKPVMARPTATCGGSQTADGCSRERPFPADRSPLMARAASSCWSYPLWTASSRCWPTRLAQPGPTGPRTGSCSPNSCTTPPRAR